MRTLCYGVQARTGPGHPWAWLTPSLSATVRPALAASWAEEQDAKDALAYLSGKFPNTELRVTRMFAVPRG